MKKLIIISIFVTGLLNSCASYGPLGAIYTAGTTGLSANNDVKSLKTGRACMTSVIGVVAAGNASIVAAKADGGITKVATVDYNVTNVLLGLYGRYCTVITGE